MCALFFFLTEKYVNPPFVGKNQKLNLMKFNCTNIPSNKKHKPMM